MDLLLEAASYALVQKTLDGLDTSYSIKLVYGRREASGGGKHGVVVQIVYKQRRRPSRLQCGSLRVDFTLSNH